MRSRRVLLAMFILLTIAASACKEPNTYGKDLPDPDIQESPPDLGARPPSPEPPLNPGVVKTSPKPVAESPQPAEQLFEVTLVADSPYFRPGNDISMPASLTLRVTNRDTTAERPTRSFTADNGAFDSGPLRAGESWTFKFPRTGRFKVIDHRAPFIYATIEVTG